ncbi:atlastin-3-like [Haemaphysalis longicornis]
MANHREIGRPIQILRLEDGSRFSFDFDALKRILLAGHVRNLPVVVISIAGKFRRGKSFLLNFFLQYMRNRRQYDWMTDPNDPELGFRWRSGSDRETTGIWIWSEIFVVTTTEGRKVAVIFLDSQGTFDCESTVKSCSTIFALSAMASTVLIYNLQQNIDESDLQHLQLFTQYGRLTMEATGKRPFQKLMFLVRDWPCAYERQYGFEGGRSLLEQRLMVSEKQEPELQNVRRDIRSCFLEMCCFLMPHPGKKVASTKSFVGLLSDIDDDFKEGLRELVPSVLHPNMLVVKKNGDFEITCQDLLVYLERQVEIFNKGALPEPRSMFEATAEANNLTAVSKAIEHYRNGMEKGLRGDKSYLDSKSLLDKHQRVEESALELFDNAPKLGGVTYSKHHKDRLKKVINELFEWFTLRNEGARIAARSQEIMEEARTNAKQLLDEARAEHEKILEKARAASSRATSMCKAMGLVIITAAAFPWLLPAAVAGAAGLASGGAAGLAAGGAAACAARVLPLALTAAGAAGAAASGTSARASQVLPLAVTGLANLVSRLGNSEATTQRRYTPSAVNPPFRRNRSDSEDDAHSHKDHSKHKQSWHK